MTNRGPARSSFDYVGAIAFVDRLLEDRRVTPHEANELKAALCRLALPILYIARKEGVRESSASPPAPTATSDRAVVSRSNVAELAAWTPARVRGTTR
jgi:hypothetical protein